MGDILQRVADLEEFHEQQQKLIKDLLKMFELNGFDMNTEEVEGKARPKELRELVEEVLGNPPEEPQRWIRIQDIPQFIDDYLIYPDRQTVDAFNDGPRWAPNQSPGHPKLVVETIEPEEPEEEYTVNDKGEPDPEYKFSGVEWAKAGLVPVGTNVLDQIGEFWHKHAKNQWIQVNSFDEDAPDYSYDAEVTQFAPLRQAEPLN
jgi:hypothetical protein